MHWSKQCAGFSEILLRELQNVRNNVILICTQCTKNGHGDRIVSAASNTLSQLEQVKAHDEQRTFANVVETILKCLEEKMEASGENLTGVKKLI